jgi:hypothetical protein
MVLSKVVFFGKGVERQYMHIAMPNMTAMFRTNDGFYGFDSAETKKTWLLNNPEKR